MNIINGNMKWIMLISGILTATMLQGLFAPQVALQGMYGADLSGPLAEIVVRNWSLLVGMVGLLLIYGGLKPMYRSPILTLAIISKSAFICLNLIYAGDMLNTMLYVAMGFDAVVIALFLSYLLTAKTS